jgi:hypothetical protein
LSEAVQDKVPSLVLEMLMGLVAGLVPPTVAVNARLVGLRLIVGRFVEAVTVSVTGMVLLGAPGAVTATVAL